MFVGQLLCLLLVLLLDLLSTGIAGLLLRYALMLAVLLNLEALAFLSLLIDQGVLLLSHISGLPWRSQS